MTILPNYDSPAALKNCLEEHGLSMQKKFGQNFLVNPACRERLVDTLELQKGSTVWEIGPGLGAMTSTLLDRGASVSAFEIDRGFCTFLRSIFADRPEFTLIEGDVIKNWKVASTTQGIPERLFGNLPYNIAATIIGDMIEDGTLFEMVLVTVQKEVALRMAAKPGTADYSSFSVLCQWAYEVTPVMDLAGGNFWPRPNVASRAVKMIPKDNWPGCVAPDVFRSLVRGLFSSRRKTIKNNLAAWLISSGKIDSNEKKDQVMQQFFSESGIDSGLRAEMLSVADFLRLSDILTNILAVVV